MVSIVKTFAMLQIFVDGCLGFAEAIGQYSPDVVFLELVKLTLRRSPPCENNTKSSNVSIKGLV